MASSQHARRVGGRQWLWWGGGSLLVLLGLALGLWQWQRAEEKRLYLAQLAAAPRLEAPRVAPSEGSRVVLQGHYLAEDTLFLDNRTHAGRLGVAPLTPLRDQHGQLWLVERGFLATGPRRVTPRVATPEGRVTLEGIWQAAGDQAPLFGPNREGRRLQRIELGTWGLEFAHAGWLHLEEGPGSLPRWWVPNVMSPERHRGYALQWWGLALAALVVMWLGGRRLFGADAGSGGDTSPSNPGT